MNTPFISIIIPVYNSENYLPSCVQSILDQDFEDFEIILVDDDSNDDSLKICRQLAASDNRIVVIHQDNAGTSAARNTGMKKARGLYTTFMDNDDFWADKRALSALHGVASTKIGRASCRERV